MSSAEPHCANHPDAVAVATCTRCGTFVCAACLPGAGTVCAACVERARVQGELPLWERYREAGVPLPIAFGRTVVEAIFEPSAFFSRVANGRGLKAPLLFAWLVEVIRTVASALFTWGVGSFPENGLLIYAAQVAVLPVRLLVFSALLAVAGDIVGLRTGAFVRAFRVVAYFHAVALPLTLIPGRVFSGLAMVIAVAIYGSIGVAAVHRTTLRRGVAASALLLVAMPCLFVALYQYFST